MNPEFLMVLPADIARVGPDGAAVLALIRYATEFDDGRHGRMTIDGQVWWRGSYADISAATGLTYDVSRRVSSKLEMACEVTVLTTAGGGDRTRIYTMPDQPTGETAIPLTSQLAEPPEGCGETARPSGETASCTTYMRNRDREKKEERDAPARDTDTLPLPISPESLAGKSKTAKTRTAKTAFPDGWRPTDQQMAALAAKYPALDIVWEFEAFENDALAAGRVYADWPRAFSGWLLRGGSYSKPPGARANSHSQKVAAVHTASQEALEVLLGPNYAAITDPTRRELA